MLFVRKWGICAVILLKTSAKVGAHAHIQSKISINVGTVSFIKDLLHLVDQKLSAYFERGGTMGFTVFL